MRSDVIHFGSDPSELENPASFADTQAAKQSLSSSVIVSIYPKQYQGAEWKIKLEKHMNQFYTVFPVWTSHTIVGNKYDCQPRCEGFIIPVCSLPQFSDQRRTSLAHRPFWSAFWSLHQTPLSPGLHPCRPEGRRYTISPVQTAGATKDSYTLSLYTFWKLFWLLITEIVSWKCFTLNYQGSGFGNYLNIWIAGEYSELLSKRYPLHHIV